MVKKLGLSSIGLIQEELHDDPWKLIVACIMLNQTNIKQVRSVIWTFFEKWSTPNMFLFAERNDVLDIIKPLGLFNRRADLLINMSQNFVQKKWKLIDELPGVGKYAADSYKIFVLCDISVIPTDKKLIQYLEWVKSIMTENDEP